MRFLLAKQVAAPLDDTFAAFADFRHAAERIQGIARVEVLTPGEIGVGVRFRETRVMLGREATEEMEITAFEPPHGYTIESESCGCVYRCEFRLRAVAGGTLVECEFVSRPRTLLAKLCAPLGWLMRGTMIRCIEQDLDDLRRFVEQRSAPAPAEAAPATIPEEERV